MRRLLSSTFEMFQVSKRIDNLQPIDNLPVLQVLAV